MSATHELEQGREYWRLAATIAKHERGARGRANTSKAREPNRGLFACVATELAMARAHIERAAKLLGVDTGAFPRVAHGGTDLREARPRATHDSRGRKIVEETRPGDGCGLADADCEASACDWCR